MSRRKWGIFAMTVALLALAVSTTWAQEEAKDEPEACQKACYAELDTCSEKCRDRVDDNLCAQECIDKKDECITKCE
jgi:hypothetical protein